MGKATLLIASSIAERRRRWVQKLQETFATCEVSERRALEQVTQNLRPQVLLLDLTMPRLKRVRGLAHIQQLSPPSKIIALTDTPDEREGIAALKAGARGYCSRDIDPPHLKKAVEAVLGGEVWVQRKFISGLLAELRNLTDSRPPFMSQPSLEGLTPREREIAQLLARGGSNKEIATRLRIAERTVKAHLSEVFRSLGVTDRLQLALFLNGYPRVRTEHGDSSRRLA